MRLEKTLLLGLIAGLFLSACVTNPETYSAVDAAVHSADYESALLALETRQTAPAGKKSPKNPIYPPKNVIMLYLDKGVLEHYASKYDTSAKDLAEAERLIEDAYTKSVSAEIASYIINDNTKDYAGEDYEDVYINIFSALNYYNMGNVEDAMVEIRSVNGKLTRLADKYEAGGSAIKEWVKDQIDGLAFPEADPVTFKRSALASYLAALFQRGEGNADELRLNLEELAAAYAAAPAIYGDYSSAALASMADEQNIPAGKARLNVLGFAGLSPVKEEEFRNIFMPFPYLQSYAFIAGDSARIGLPKLVARENTVNRIEVEVEGQGKFNLNLIEDMGLVMLETYKAKYSLNFLKALVSAELKYLAAELSVRALKENGAPELAIVASIIATKKGIDALNRADIRMARYFPRDAFGGGINLDPGTYTVKVNYYGKGGLVDSKRYDGVKVAARKLNLIEGVCLK